MALKYLTFLQTLTDALKHLLFPQPVTKDLTIPQTVTFSIKQFSSEFAIVFWTSTAHPPPLSPIPVLAVSVGSVPSPVTSVPVSVPITVSPSVSVPVSPVSTVSVPRSWPPEGPEGQINAINNYDSKPEKILLLQHFLNLPTRSTCAI